jgi:hypothetical protein
MSRTLRRSQETDSLIDMSEHAVELLEAFDALPEDDKRAFTLEFLRRAVPFDSGPLDDLEIAHAADQLLATLE